jgi:hypothetical protein
MTNDEQGTGQDGWEDILTISCRTDEVTREREPFIFAANVRAGERQQMRLRGPTPV